jgi:hypothetical protein
MKTVLKMKLWLSKLLFSIDSDFIHKKRVAQYTLEYYEYSIKIKKAMPVEEVRKLKQKLNLLSIYISPSELRKIHKSVNNYLQNK